MELIMMSELLSNLEYLVLAQNQIKCLPKKFSNVLITSLKLIDLRENQTKKSGIPRGYFHIVILGYDLKQKNDKVKTDSLWDIDSYAHSEIKKSKNNLIVFNDHSALHLI